jgi:hypothetical protein
MSKKEELLKTFESIKTALKNNDLIKINELFAEDYKGFGLRGDIETKEIVLRSFQPGGVKISEYDTEDLRIEVFTEIGIISGKGFISGSYGEYIFRHNVLFTDIFILNNDTWYYLKSQATEITDT